MLNKLYTNNTEQKTEFKGGSYITFTNEALSEMFGYVDEFDTECGGMAQVERIEHKFDDGDIEYEYRISEIFLPNQCNTGSTTDINAEEMGKLLEELIAQDKDTSKLRGHWHSHVNMSVFHSGTDSDNYDDLRTGSWLVSIVANKKGDLLGRVDFYEPVRMSITGLPIFLVSENDKRIEDKVKANVARVKKYEEDNRKVKYSNNYSGYGSFGGHLGDTSYMPSEVATDYGCDDDYIESDLIVNFLVEQERANQIVLIYDDLTGALCGYYDLTEGMFYNVTAYRMTRTEEMRYAEQLDLKHRETIKNKGV